MSPADRVKLQRDTAEAEGLRLKAYQDSEGVWTIGHGTNLQELVIDPILAEQWLVDKLVEAEAEAQRFPFYAGLSSVRQRAMVELIYNLGRPRLMGFVKFLAAMQAEDFQTAAAELLDSKWAAQVKASRAGRIADMVREG